jgi:HTH-type transcriptional regulator/antitoxin HipB
MEYSVLTPAQLSLHLRSLRKARHLTQAGLGQKIGVNQARIGKIEADPSSVSVGQLMQILALLGVRLVLKEIPPTVAGLPPSTEASEW